MQVSLEKLQLLSISFRLISNDVPSVHFFFSQAPHSSDVPSSHFFLSQAPHSSDVPSSQFFLSQTAAATLLFAFHLY